MSDLSVFCCGISESESKNLGGLDGYSFVINGNSIKKVVPIRITLSAMLMRPPIDSMRPRVM
jgi:hypothetical protein